MHRNWVMKKNRHYIQIFSAFLFNSYLLGFRDKTIFKGKTKMACVPILNCYSCPSALGACPIGALQASLGDINNKTACAKSIVPLANCEQPITTARITPK